MLSRVPQQLRSGQHAIWQFLSDVDGHPAKLALIGPPGSGKTTLLKHLALALVDPNPARPKYVPVIMFLREHANAISGDQNITIATLLSHYLTTRRELAIPPQWFDTIMKHGHALVMLDGLDEVADLTQRKDVADWVDRQITIHAANPFILTSRRHGYTTNPLSNVTVLDIRPFTNTQVRTFLHKWYVANEIKDQNRDDPGVRKDAKDGAEDLLALFRTNRALRGLSVSPLLLTMIATVHKYRNALPGSRAELYEHICDVTFEKRQTEKKLAVTLTAWQKRRVLEPLAWHMMEHDISAIAEREAESVIQNALRHIAVDMTTAFFLQYVEDETGIILKREQQEYQFVHLTFQEYLAACHVKTHQQHKYTLCTQVGNSWWRECIRLYCALCDPAEIIMACMLAMTSDALALGIECRSEAKELNPAVALEFDKLLEDGLANASVKSIASAILKVRLARMIEVDESRYVDGDLIWCAEYQLFIDDMRSVGRYLQPAHWPKEVATSKDAVKPVSGIHFAHALQFCEWLTRREGGEWQFSLSTDEEHKKYPLLQKELMPWRVRVKGVMSTEPSWECIKGLQARYGYVVEHTLTALRNVIVVPWEEKPRKEHVVDDVALLTRKIAKLTSEERNIQEVFWQRLLGGAFVTGHGEKRALVQGADTDLISAIRDNDYIKVSRKLDLARFSAGSEWYRQASTHIELKHVDEFSSALEGLRDIFGKIANDLGVPNAKRVMMAVNALVVGAKGAAEAALMVSERLGTLGRLLSRDRAGDVAKGLLEIAENSRELKARVERGDLSEVSRDAHRLETRLMVWQEGLANLCYEYQREAYSSVPHTFVADNLSDLKVARANARFLADYKVGELDDFYHVVQRLSLVDPQAYVGVEQFGVNLDAICADLIDDNKVWESLQMAANPSQLSKFLYYCAICHCLLMTALWPKSCLAALELAVMSGVRHEKIKGEIKPFEALRLAKVAASLPTTVKKRSER